MTPAANHSGPVPSRAIALFRAWLADRRGGAIIEFAMVVAPFVAVLLASFEIAILFFAQQGLETAAEASARAILTGQVQKAGTTQAQFKTLVCKQLPPMLSCANLMVDVRKADTFDTISTSNPTITYDAKGNVNNSWNFTPGGAGSIVILRLMYVWSTPVGPLSFNLSNLPNGQRLMVASAVFKSEPYT